MDKRVINFINNTIESKRKNNEKLHYAFLLYKNELVSEGTNDFIKDKTCTTIHAEMSALKKWKRLHNSCNIDLVVIKLKKNGDIGEGKPCNHCIKLLSESKMRIINVYYSVSSVQIIKEKFSKMKNYDKLSDKKILSKSMRYKCGEKIFFN